MNLFVTLIPIKINDTKLKVLNDCLLSFVDSCTIPYDKESTFVKSINKVCDNLNRLYPNQKKIGIYDYEKNRHFSIVQIPYRRSENRVLAINMRPVHCVLGYSEINEIGTLFLSEDKK